MQRFRNACGFIAHNHHARDKITAGGLDQTDKQMDGPRVIDLYLSTTQYGVYSTFS